MKKFIFQIMKFGTFTITLLGLLFFSTFYIIKAKSDLSITKNIDKIVLGNSHSECAFDNSEIQNFANFSSSGETYFYTYFKIRQLLEKNSHVKTIFLEFSNSRVYGTADDRIWSDDSIFNSYPTYGPFMGLEDNWLLIRNNPSGFLENLSLSLKNDLKVIATGDYKYTKKIGKYRRIKQAVVGGIDEANPSDSTNFKISDYNLYYLEKIIKLCEENNVEIYLVRTPLHPKYFPLTYEGLFQEKLKSKFPNIEFLDFKDFPMSDSEYADPHHLNYLGSNKFSLFFNELLENGILEKENKQNFINSEIEKL